MNLRDATPADLAILQHWDEQNRSKSRCIVRLAILEGENNEYDEICFE